VCRATLPVSLQTCRSSDAIAYGYYDDLVNETGWSFLNVKSSEAASAVDQSYGAGFLEGVLTQTRVFQVRFPLPFDLSFAVTVCPCFTGVHKLRWQRSDAGGHHGLYQRAARVDGLHG
jgi:hypothetical protein